MSVIIVLIIISVLVAIFFLGVFVWAVKTGQFDDTVSPSIRILFDDKKQEKDSGENGASEKSDEQKS
jgi:cbb3-type cytochrome oxidase maturation protein